MHHHALWQETIKACSSLHNARASSLKLTGSGHYLGAQTSFALGGLEVQGVLDAEGAILVVEGSAAFAQASSRQQEARPPASERSQGTETAARDIQLLLQSVCARLVPYSTSKPLLVFTDC